MKLSSQEKENIITLARAVLSGPHPSPNEYALLGTALRDYEAVEYLAIFDENDKPGLQQNGAVLIWHLLDPLTKSELPSDLPEESLVVHSQNGLGTLRVNGSAADGSIRIICIDFHRGGFTYVRARDEYLGFYPPVERQGESA
jgi:hypothetical protein